MSRSTPLTTDPAQAYQRNVLIQVETAYMTSDRSARFSSDHIRALMLAGQRY